MKRFPVAIILLVVLSIVELALLLTAIGAFPSPTDRKLVFATSEFVRDPNPQTELDLYKEIVRTERREVNIERVASLIVVFNTVALMSAFRRARRLRGSNEKGRSTEGNLKAN